MTRGKKRGSGGLTRDALCMAATVRDHQGRPVHYFCTRTRHGDADHQAVTDDGPIDWRTSP